MSDPVLLVERETAVATVTLNRPNQMNALNAELRIALGDALAELEADPEIRAVVLTGAGRAFCAGMDLKEIGGGSEGQTGYELSVAGQDAMRAGFERTVGERQCERPRACENDHRLVQTTKALANDQVRRAWRPGRRTV